MLTQNSFIVRTTTVSSSLVDPGVRERLHFLRSDFRSSVTFSEKLENSPRSKELQRSDVESPANFGLSFFGDFWITAEQFFSRVPWIQFCETKCQNICAKSLLLGTLLWKKWLKTLFETFASTPYHVKVAVIVGRIFLNFEMFPGDFRFKHIQHKIDMMYF